jgi:hypothetical protein
VATGHTDLRSSAARLSDAELRDRQAAILARVLWLLLDERLTLSMLEFYSGAWAALDAEAQARGRRN